MPAAFWDTYALVEFRLGNPKFLDIAERASVVTSRLNLMEAYYIALRRSSLAAAETTWNAFRPCALDASDDDLRDAMKFRLRKRRERKALSYVDAVGYTMARGRGVRFLTGDPALRGLPGVEFVR